MEQSSFGRLAGVLFAPVKTLQGLTEKPTWWLPLVILALLATGLNYISVERIDLEKATRQAIAQRSGQEPTQDQVDKAVDVQLKLQPVTRVLPLVAVPVIYLIVALLFWLIFKGVGNEFRYSVSLALTVHSQVPLIIATLLSFPVVLSRSELTLEEARRGLLASNLAAFAPEGTSTPLLSVLASLDVFTVWALVLMIIGYGLAARVRRGTSIAVVVGVWALYVAGKAGFAALFS